jgi:hypothetical protein
MPAPWSVASRLDGAAGSLSTVELHVLQIFGLDSKIATDDGGCAA